jgi:hypothetical protein
MRFLLFGYLSLTIQDKKYVHENEINVISSLRTFKEMCPTKPAGTNLERYPASGVVQ